jgi:flagellar motility protein MotE (MotC chaperone)
MTFLRIAGQMATQAKFPSRIATYGLSVLALLAFANAAVAQTPSTPVPVSQNQMRSAKQLPVGPLILQPPSVSTKRTPSRPPTKQRKNVADVPPNGKPGQSNTATIRKDPRIVGYGLELLNAPIESRPNPNSGSQSSEAPTTQPSKPNEITISETLERQSVAILKSAPQPAKCEDISAQSQNLSKLVEITKKYCSSNNSALEQVRLNWQKAELEALERRVTLVLQELDKKIEGLQALRKEAALEKVKAEQKVVAIIAEMRPDAAAQQISAMEAGAAVSVLSGLPPKAASQILNEMQPKLAAQLTQAMAEVRSRGRSSTSASQ